MNDKITNTSREVQYAVGLPKEYTSMYGYPKRIYPVFKLAPGETLDDSNTRYAHGWIKEERIGDENGNVVTTVFYEKNNWRASGMIRFFASPEALLIACGKTPVHGKSADKEITDKMWGMAREKPVNTPPIFLLGNVQETPLQQIAGPGNVPQLEGPKPKKKAKSKTKKKPAKRPRPGSRLARPKKSVKKVAKKTKKAKKSARRR